MSLDLNNIVKFQEGDAACFNDIYNESYNRVYFNVYRTFKNETLTKDVTQNVFVIVFRSLSQLRDPKAYYTWLDRITRTCIVNKVKEFEKSHIIFDLENVVDIPPQPNEIYNFHEVKRIVLMEIKKLPLAHQEVAKLRFLDEMSIKEIADELNIPEGTVKTRLIKIKNDLQIVLKSKNIIPTTAFGTFLTFQMSEAFKLWCAEISRITPDIPEFNQFDLSGIDKAPGFLTSLAYKIKDFFMHSSFPARSALAAITIIPTMFILTLSSNRSHMVNIESIQYSTAFTNQVINVAIKIKNPENIKNLTIINLDTNQGYSAEERDNVFKVYLDSNGTYEINITNVKDQYVKKAFVIKTYDNIAPAILESSLDSSSLNIKVADDISGIAVLSSNFEANGISYNPTYNKETDTLSFEIPTQIEGGLLTVSDNAGNWSSTQLTFSATE